MSIIDDQRNQMHAEIRSARQSARRAENAALAERSKYLWSKKNPTWACEANFQIMENYLANAGILVSEDALDLAFQACKSRNQLAERITEREVPEPTLQERRLAENERLRGMSIEELRAEVQAGIKKKLASPEYGSHGAVYVPNFTAQEFLRMSPSQVKALIFHEGSRQERPGVRAGIDKLLRDAQLLKDATN